GVRQGDTISPWYDPMIAKVITHGSTRAIALARLQAALEGTQVAGSVTNRDFLGALTRHEGFKAGQVDTGLIGRDLDALTVRPAVSVPVIALAALAAMGAGQGDAQERAMAGFALWSPLWQAVPLVQGDATHDCAVARDGAGWRVRINGSEHRAEHRAGGWWIDGARVQGEARCHADQVSVMGAVSVHFTRPDPLAVDAAAGAEAGLVLAPMPGLVKSVFVSAGETVEKGARLAVLEAMKMEHTLTAGRDGTIAQVLAKPGDQVEAGVALIVLEDE
ncbi:MAG: 3-methylcrotonyl-CoA carboxylase, partial [Pararhodobacter sp.]|nr:3-methylcrotonyl-CoA carboxylase [Pararhodobacter sp.]